MYAGCHKWNKFKSKHMGSITGDCESCQNEISALANRVNRVDVALGQGGNLISAYCYCKSPPVTLIVHGKIICVLIVLAVYITPKTQLFDHTTQSLGCLQPGEIWQCDYISTQAF